MLPPTVTLACTLPTGNIDADPYLTTKSMSKQVEAEMNQYYISHDHTLMQ